MDPLLYQNKGKSSLMQRHPDFFSFSGLVKHNKPLFSIEILK